MQPLKREFLLPCSIHSVKVEAVLTKTGVGCFVPTMRLANFRVNRTDCLIRRDWYLPW
jgi:hypothetical protein